MVYVQDRELRCKLAAQRVEQIQENNGIGAARDSDANALSGREHAVLADVSGDVVNQI